MHSRMARPFRRAGTPIREARGAGATGTEPAGRSTCTDGSRPRYRPRMHDACRVDPGTKANLARRSTDARLGVAKSDAPAEMARLTDRLSVLQGRLYAEQS